MPPFDATAGQTEDQLEREVREALRFQRLPPNAQTEWLRANFWPLQEAASALYAKLPPRPGTARHFATMEEKNRYDEARALEEAFLIQRALAT